MKPHPRDLDKDLYQHLGLFGAPSVKQLEASRGRIRERLRGALDASVYHAPSEVRSRGVYSWRLALTLTAATVMALVAFVPWQRTDWIATVEAADGSHYSLAAHTPLRSNPSGGTLLTLTDGTRVEMRAQSELLLERATDGIGIRLRTGSLIVNAAQQRRDRLYVHTKDMTVAVLGTLLAVNTEDLGSRVTAIEGNVRVREASGETMLRPGQEVSTSQALATRPVKEIIGWSRQADRILAVFTNGMRDTGAPLEAIGSGAFARARAQTSADGQTSAPDFEAASIKPCDPDHLPQAPEGARGGGANSLQLTRGRVRALCMTIATLIRTAYGLTPADLAFEPLAGGLNNMKFGDVYGLGQEDGRRVRGGPDWVRSERYTVEAVANGTGSDDPTMLRGLMLRRLLEQRLHAKVHIESEDVPAYALSVAKGGLKMKSVTPDACDALPGREGSPLFFGYPGSVLTPPRTLENLQRGEKPSCGMWRHRHGPNMVIIGGNMPVAALIRSLGMQLGGVRVIDRTSLADTDRFNYLLEYAVDDNAPSLPGGELPAGPQPVDVLPAATIFTALEEQLGLRLEPAKAPREYIVIDHVERPSPN